MPLRDAKPRPTRVPESQGGRAANGRDGRGSGGRKHQPAVPRKEQRAPDSGSGAGGRGRGPRGGAARRGRHASREQSGAGGGLSPALPRLQPRHRAPPSPLARARRARGGRRGGVNTPQRTGARAAGPTHHAPSASHAARGWPHDCFIGSFASWLPPPLRRPFPFSGGHGRKPAILAAGPRCGPFFFSAVHAVRARSIRLQEAARSSKRGDAEGASSVKGGRGRGAARRARCCARHGRQS